MGKDFNCELCSEELDSRDKLKVHIEREHETARKSKPKNFKCHVCGYKCSSGRDLNRHTRTQTGERPFQCEFSACGMAFKTESALTKHIKFKHSSERRFKCDFPSCRRTSKTASDLNQHKKSHTEERPFACTHSRCNYRAKRKEDLWKHVANIHTDSKKLACSKCKYSTNYASHLSRHMTVHEGKNKKIPCSMDGCEYKGKNSEAFKQHMRLHKASLPCPVPRCGRYVLTKEALKEHVKLHKSKGRAFQCPLCFKHYPTLFKLQQHCFVHTKEKPFKCGHCELGAARRDKIKAHISSVHAEIEFPFIVHLLDDRECI